MVSFIGYSRQLSVWKLGASFVSARGVDHDTPVLIKLASLTSSDALSWALSAPPDGPYGTANEGRLLCRAGFPLGLGWRVCITTTSGSGTQS